MNFWRVSPERNPTVASVYDVVKGVAKRCPGGVLPRAYLVLDIETNGLHWNPPKGKKPDVVAQLGWAAVNSQQLVRSGFWYAKRPSGTMKGTKASEVNGITDEMLAERGIQPRDMYARAMSLIGLYRESGCMFMGHNFMKFDKPFIEAELGRNGVEFEFPRNGCIDTGMIFKAAQMGVAPAEDEDLTGFFARISAERSRVRWKLELAAQKYGLVEKHNLDMTKAHDAGFDCRLTHYFFEEMRRWLATEGMVL
jgi:DNA polymerase III epsilon subunit-like protein